MAEFRAKYECVIGLVKYARMYGLASDEAASLAIARRGMNLSERLQACHQRLFGGELLKARMALVVKIE